MIYDLLILGAGAAGLTASIYSSRYKMTHLIFGEKPGGQCVDAHIIENYPGFISITGADLTQKLVDHAESYGVKIITEGVGLIRKVDATPISDDKRSEKRSSCEVNIEIKGFTSSAEENPLTLTSEGKTFSEPELSPLPSGSIDPLLEISTKSGATYQAKSLILAMGARHRALNVPGETDFLGRGVSYCATCDAPLFKGKTVAIVGGGDSAVTASLLLAEYAVKVYLIHRRNDFRAERIWIEKMRANKKIEEVLGNEIVRVFGKKELREIQELSSSKDSPSDEGKSFSEAGSSSATAASTKGADLVGAVELKETYRNNKIITVDGVFVEVGLIPATALASAIGVTVTPDGYLETTADGRTNVPGVFAAGDLCRVPGTQPLRQIVTSAAAGALAAAAAYSYLNKKAPAPSWG